MELKISLTISNKYTNQFNLSPKFGAFFIFIKKCLDNNDLIIYIIHIKIRNQS